MSQSDVSLLEAREDIYTFLGSVLAIFAQSETLA